MSGKHVVAKADVAKRTGRADVDKPARTKTVLITEPACYPEDVDRRGRTITDVRTKFEDAIREIRQRPGRASKVTWDAVAVILEVDPSTLRRWCKEDGIPHPGAIARLMPR